MEKDAMGLDVPLLLGKAFQERNMLLGERNETHKQGTTSTYRLLQRLPWLVVETIRREHMAWPIFYLRERSSGIDDKYMEETVNIDGKEIKQNIQL